MKKDTKPFEELLARTKANLKAIRTEIHRGASLDHVYQELQQHEQIFSSRLNELSDWNDQEKQREAQAKETEDKADRAAKLEATKVKLLATPREELVKIAAGNKAVIDIKAETTIAEIVDAILKTAPETI